MADEEWTSEEPGRAPASGGTIGGPGWDYPKATEYRSALSASSRNSRSLDAHVAR